jgi:hypothetical protein
MGVRELEFDQTAVLRIGAHSRVGYIRTRKTDPERSLPGNGDSTAPSVKVATPEAAQEPTLLELYRKDPSALIERVEREARRARAEECRAWLRRIFA